MALCHHRTNALCRNQCTFRPGGSISPQTLLICLSLTVIEELVHVTILDLHNIAKVTPDPTWRSVAITDPELSCHDRECVTVGIKQRLELRVVFWHAEHTQ